MQYYIFKICNLTRKLPIIKIGRKTSLASLSILGDVELVDCLADLMAKKLRREKFDYLVGPEVKVLPLIHSIAKKLGHKRFMICRKSVKPYMISPIVIKPLPYFPKHTRPLVLSGDDAQLLEDKKVIIVDDVVSTGVTVRMMEKMMEKVKAQVVGVMAVVKQGKQFDEIKNFTYFAELPIFKVNP